MKVAIVGTGSVARNSYLPPLAKQEDVVISYLNRSPEKAEACARDFGGHACSSVAELMEDEPDAVLVLTREMQRYDTAIALLEHAPKRLFFEKPLVAQHDQAHISEDDFGKGHDLLARAQAAGCETAMVFNYRFFDQTLKAQEICRERAFGQVIQTTGLVHYACWSHCIDLVHAFAGPSAQLAAVSGPTERTGAGMTASDLAVSFTTVAGTAGTIIGTCGTSFGFPLFELTFSFERGRISFRGLDADLEVLDYAGTHHETYALTRQTSRWEQYTASFAKALVAYLDSVRTGSAPPVPGLAGLQELQFEAAARRAVREQRTVSVQSEFPISI